MTDRTGPDTRVDGPSRKLLSLCRLVTVTTRSVISPRAKGPSCSQDKLKAPAPKLCLFRPPPHPVRRTGTERPAPSGTPWGGRLSPQSYRVPSG